MFTPTNINYVFTQSGDKKKPTRGGRLTIKGVSSLRSCSGHNMLKLNQAVFSHAQELCSTISNLV